MTKQQLFYGHDTGQYVLAGISASVVKDDCHHKKRAMFSSKDKAITA